MERWTDLFGLLGRKQEEVPEEVLRLAEERTLARKAKEWAKSDALRVRLAELGWLAEDSPKGQKLRKA